MDPIRKLSAILSSDVVGYSRLMGEDERATLETLKAYRQVIGILVADHGGRVVDSPGDALLADFPSAVEAVRCAVEMQRELAQRNAMLPEHRRMVVRIGINLGDVIEQDAALYGDGVNIAARLQALAEPGGICVSGTVYDQIEGKIPLTLRFVGEQTVKNIPKAIRAYYVAVETGQAANRAKPPRQRASRRALWISVVLLLLLAAGAGIWTYANRAGLSSKEMGFASAGALQLPDKPSIAVLPFVNMSDDPKQEYFSDGMTEDVITSLSKRSGLFVIARNSVFTYKGRAVKPEQVSRELGVRYILEGSVRKADQQVRITAQLIDTTSGYHLWAEHYDGKLRDIFALQDGITQKIVAAIAPKLLAGEQPLSGHPETNNIEAYDLVLRGIPLLNGIRKDSTAAARQMFQTAIALDPHYARAYANLAWVYFISWEFQWTPDSQDRSLEAAKKAVALDDSSSDAHCVLGWNLLWKKQHDLAIGELEKAVSLDSNNSDAYTFLGEVLNFAGKPEEAIGFHKKAMRLDPNYPFYVMFNLAHSYFLLRRYDEALAAYGEVLSRNPDFLPAHEQLAVVYIEQGQKQRAQAEVAECLRINPGDSLALLRALPYKSQADLDRNISALREAGLK